ncbi:MAG TPA: ferritin-like domain-containing protein [Allosphingosinicella sp.]|nr:ferritin-like domain-containing protein [Allosphingosinicella sp.]
MSEDSTLIDVMESRAKRREERRGFFKLAAAGVAAAPVVLTMGGKPLSAQTAVTDADILNFALNLEYLEAQFYYFAFFGEGLPTGILGGTGTRGNVRGGRKVNFTDQVVAQYAAEIAADERAHVEFLRGALGAAAVAQPELDISADPNGAFSSAARAAGLITAGQSFDPYANDENFLLGAFIFEDVGVTAYKGASPLITNKTFLEAAAGILAVEAYHAAIVRTTLYRKGIQTPALITATERISDARDSLDGTSDKDQGVANRDNASNIAPLDGNGLAYSRTAGEVLNIVYLTSMARNQGGFFPNGVNGTIRTSSAN